MSPKVYCIDVDGTLCDETCWTCNDVELSTPNVELIEAVNKLHLKNFIIIHTARRHELYHATIKWLDKNGVRYHAVSFEKTPGTPIDLDAINLISDI